MRTGTHTHGDAYGQGDARAHGDTTHDGDASTPDDDATPAREVDLELQHRLDERLREGLLERVAVTLASTLDLKEVLRRLAEMGRDASRAQRCSILLVERDRLTPAGASSGEPDDALWEAFRRMPSIWLSPERFELLHEGRAFAIPDARQSPYVPAEWAERFALRTLAIVPLLAHGEPCGIMAIDWPEVRDVPDGELALLEAIGAYAGVAVHNARLHQQMAFKTRTLEHIVSVASSLNASMSLDHTLEAVCLAYEQVLEATHCSVNLTDPADPSRLHLLASRGERWFTRDGQAVLPEELIPIEEIRQTPSGSIAYPNVRSDDVTVEAPASVRSAALFPLFGPDGVIGAVVVGFPDERGPREPELEAGQTLAELAAAAIGRADLHGQLERRIRQIELLSRLSEVVSGDGPLDDVLTGVNDALSPELDTRVDGLVVADVGARDALGAAPPEPDEAAVIEAWDAEAASGATPLRLRPAGDWLLVPVTRHPHVLGALRVGGAGGPGGTGGPGGPGGTGGTGGAAEAVSFSDEEFLLALGGAFAEMVHRGGAPSP